MKAQTILNGIKRSSLLLKVKNLKQNFDEINLDTSKAILFRWDDFKIRKDEVLKKYIKSLKKQKSAEFAIKMYFLIKIIKKFSKMFIK
jgi:hypothetical protein